MPQCCRMLAHSFAAFHSLQWHRFLRFACEYHLLSVTSPGRSQSHTFREFVLEEVECEWKADGIEIELSSDALGHSVRSPERIVAAEDVRLATRASLVVIHAMTRRCKSLFPLPLGCGPRQDNIVKISKK